ncbi:MAG: AfsR/SARP family transcriptional regulator, partial [Candidatus Polarisedimenticolia bacterium]
GSAAAPDAGAAAGGGADERCGAASGTADLTVRLLGPVEVYRDPQRRIPARAWKIRRAFQVFCFLAVARDHHATRERLADVLWSDARPSAIERSFHPTISCLRRALNHAHDVPKSFLQYGRGGYLLNPAYRYDIDTEAFEALVQAARRKASRGDAPGALADYESGLALYRGPLLEDDYDRWIEAPRHRYETLYAAALGEAGELHLGRGGAEAAEACFRTLVDRSPLDEQVSGRLMRALGAHRDGAGIEKEYARLSQALAEERAAPPRPETHRVFDESLAAAAATGGGEEGRAARAVPPAPPAARHASRRGPEAVES